MPEGGRMGRYCSNCGRDLEGMDGAFCPGCGRPTSQTARVPVPSEDVPSPSGSPESSGGGYLRTAVTFVVAFVVLVGLVAVLVVAFGGNTPPDDTQSGEAGAEGNLPGSGETFDQENFGELAADPDAHRGASVEVVGRLLESPETREGQTAFQMYADPEGRDDTLVIFTEDIVSVEADDYARVSGTVVGTLEGENAFGASLSLPRIEASSVEPVDAVEAIDPAQEVLDQGSTVTDPAGFSVTLEKIEFGEETTRAYLSARNDTGYPASFYAFNSRIIQGPSQAEPDNALSYDFDLDEPQSDLSPGVETEGVIVYGPADPFQPFEVHFEWSSENYEITPTEIVFQSE